MKTKPFLGLAIRSLTLEPGERVTLREMVDWCEAAGEKITYQRLQQVEQRALRKIRIHLMCELNNDAKEVLLDGLSLLSQSRGTMWDRTVRHLNSKHDSI